MQFSLNSEKFSKKVIGIFSTSINSEKEISVINLAIKLYMDNKFDEKIHHSFNR